MESRYSESNRRWRAWAGAAAVLTVCVLAFIFAFAVNYGGPIDKDGAGSTFVILALIFGGSFFVLQVVEAIASRGHPLVLRIITVVGFALSAGVVAWGAANSEFWRTWQCRRQVIPEGEALVRALGSNPESVFAVLPDFDSGPEQWRAAGLEPRRSEGDYGTVRWQLGSGPLSTWADPSWKDEASRVWVALPDSATEAEVSQAWGEPLAYVLDPVWHQPGWKIRVRLSPVDTDCGMRQGLEAQRVMPYADFFTDDVARPLAGFEGPLLGAPVSRADAFFGIHTRREREGFTDREGMGPVFPHSYGRATTYLFADPEGRVAAWSITTGCPTTEACAFLVAELQRRFGPFRWSWNPDAHVVYPFERRPELRLVNEPHSLRLELIPEGAR